MALKTTTAQPEPTQGWSVRSGRGCGAACGTCPLTRGTDTAVTSTSLRCCLRCPPQARARRVFWGMEVGFCGQWHLGSMTVLVPNAATALPGAGGPKISLPGGVWHTAPHQLVGKVGTGQRPSACSIPLPTAALPHHGPTGPRGPGGGCDHLGEGRAARCRTPMGGCS